MGAIKMFTPYDLRPTIEITAFTLTALSTFVVGTRSYCRIWIVGRLKLYDYITWGAVLCTWALCVCNHYQLKFGTGAQGQSRNLPHINKDQTRAYLYHELLGSAASWYAYHIGYLLSLAFVKLSILVFYLSFATRRTFRILVHITILIVAAFSVAMILIIALQCPKKPLFALSPGIMVDRRRTHCFDLRVVFYYQAGFNMASDLVILLLPMPLLFRLRMDRVKRFSLLAVFSVGFLVPIASGIRLWGLYLWANSGHMGRYYGGYVIFWSQVELNTAIICASAPSLQPLFKQVFHKLPPLQRSRGPYYYYGGGHNSTTSSPGVEVREVRCARRDSISDLARPVATYEPKIRAQNTIEPKIVFVNLTGEEEIRARIRAFSNPSSPSYSQPASPTHPARVFTAG